ncbi:3-phosphoserine/phosphohydroxythreonine transaminase [Alienimonas californiensis]|uniref:Phosphoserine aminotransferase n=1 Tax=Alienimonas californiensis TaxID=2527989 RepID=A0A517PBZ9_9PLAN|nr:3-phosphoserine/phosphohydroxythreonine transaminase [Alienimonas californiensis]QDT16907.1 Phosphoserine aminotransferase [Alienimonas californiensis]
MSAPLRHYNFSAGPAVLPESVLEEAGRNLMSLGDTGVGIMEHSHRGKPFVAIIERAEALIRKIANVPDGYSVLFLQGGASLQFAMCPMNFLPDGGTADYLMTGSWSKKAGKEAKLFGKVHTACSSEATNFDRIPSPAETTYSDDPAYVHFTSNNTIFGTQFPTEPTPPGDAFLVCDASSDIFSRPVDVSKYGLLYAGAQKNLGPSGVTLAILRNDLLERKCREVPAMLDYKTYVEGQSLYNTPPTFGIYVLMLVLEWIEKEGGLSAIGERNEAKATKLYDYLDSSKLFKPTAAKGSRSLMNVCFVTGNEETDAAFIKYADERGLKTLKGHRSVGGMRASLYNAFPPAGVDKLIEAMQEFESTHAA